MTDLKNFYLALALDPASTVLLLGKFKQEHPRRYAHHVTLAFNPVAYDLADWAPGSKATATVYEHGFDKLAQAVRVTMTSSHGHEEALRADGRHLHVTITVAAAGSPADSNKIPEANFVRVSPFALSGEVKLIPKRG